MNTVLWIIGLSAAGTFALRWLPLRQALRPRPAQPPSSAPQPLRRLLQSLLAGVGPAAITALLVVSLWGLAGSGAGASPSVAALMAITAGLCALLLTRRWVKGIAAPTLAGACVYGLCMQWLMG